MEKAAKKGDYLNIDRLLEQYDPLIKSIYNRFSSYNGLCNNSDDYEDLKAQIQFEFVKLCREYNPTRGVDFPGYIKMLLQQRVYHHITKLQRIQQNETVSYTKSYDYGNEASLDFDNMYELADENVQKELERVEALASLDWRAIVGRKHKYLIESILFEGKTIEEIAKLEGVTIKTVRLRLHFACKRLIEWNQEMEDYTKFHNSLQGKQEIMESPSSTFISSRVVKRQPIYVRRQPIMVRQPILISIMED